MIMDTDYPVAPGENCAHTIVLTCIQFLTDMAEGFELLQTTLAGIPANSSKADVNTILMGSSVRLGGAFTYLQNTTMDGKFDLDKNIKLIREKIAAAVSLEQQAKETNTVGGFTTDLYFGVDEYLVLGCALTNRTTLVFFDTKAGDKCTSVDSVDVVRIFTSDLKSFGIEKRPRRGIVIKEGAFFGYTGRQLKLKGCNMDLQQFDPTKMTLVAYHGRHYERCFDVETIMRVKEQWGLAGKRPVNWCVLENSESAR